MTDRRASTRDTLTLSTMQAPSAVEQLPGTFLPVSKNIPKHGAHGAANLEPGLGGRDTLEPELSALGPAMSRRALCDCSHTNSTGTQYRYTTDILLFTQLLPPGPNPF
jgi:hypothetical protein